MDNPNIEDIIKELGAAVNVTSTAVVPTVTDPPPSMSESIGAVPTLMMPFMLSTPNERPSTSTGALG